MQSEQYTCTISPTAIKYEYNDSTSVQYDSKA